MIHYQKASLFDAPEGSLIVHAVNCRGVWGSGIAKEFKARYPNSYQVYKAHCDMISQNDLIGVGYFSLDFKHNIGCLFTSIDYGKNVDNPVDILKNTESAVYQLLEQARDNEIEIVYSNKFNSGLFNVPWEETEAVLKKALELFPEIEWVVMDPELNELDIFV